MLSHIVAHLDLVGLAGATAFVLGLALTPFVRAAAVRAGWVTKPVSIKRLGHLAPTKT